MSMKQFTLILVTLSVVVGFVLMSRHFAPRREFNETMVSGQGSGEWIVYLDGGPPGVEHLSAPNMQARFASMGYQFAVVESWQDVLDESVQHAIAFLVFDSASQTQLDVAWIKPRYSSGMGVAGIGVFSDDLSILLDDPSADSKNGHAWTTCPEVYSIALHRIAGTPLALTEVASWPDPFAPTAVAIDEQLETYQAYSEDSTCSSGGIDHFYRSVDNMVAHIRTWGDHYDYSTDVP